MTIRVRLAPSPTGTLHIGTARTALFNWLFASSLGGKFLIRIEDTDKERSKKEFTNNILEGLTWLGLTWDEEPFIQSNSIQNHKAAIKKLLDSGKAYHCYATEEELDLMREEQKAKGIAPRYDNRHRNLSLSEKEAFKKEGKEPVIRFRISDNSNIEWNDLVRGKMQWRGSDLGGDMVIARRAPEEEIGDPLYNLVVVVDDNLMNISHVIRGEDHLANTAKQILLYEALNLQKPTFAHTPLILNEEGKKLSKRDGVTSISEFKEKGYTSEAIANYMTLLGWSVPEGMNEIFKIKDIRKSFTINRINKSGAKFDWDKLNWINSQVIHNLPEEDLFNILNPLWLKEDWKVNNKEWGVELANLLKPSLVLLVDGVSQARPFFKKPSLTSEAINQLKIQGAKESLNILIQQLQKTPWDGKDIDFAKNLLKISAEQANVKRGLLMKSLRAALLGEVNGPDLLISWRLLAQSKKDQERLSACL